MAHVEPNRTDLARLLAALKAEADGKELRRDLRAGLRKAVTPAVQVARGSILAMGVKGGIEAATGSLRTAVAAATKLQTRLGARRAGVRVAVKKNTMPRGFRNAPKRLNSKKGWRHPVFGTDRWVTQRGQPDWFDGSMEAAKPEAVAAVKEAMDNIAERISARTRR